MCIHDAIMGVCRRMHTHTHIHTQTLHSPARHVQEVLNRRLFSTVREKKRLTYDANFHLTGFERIHGGWCECVYFVYGWCECVCTSYVYMYTYVCTISLSICRCMHVYMAAGVNVWYTVHCRSLLLISRSILRKIDLLMSKRDHCTQYTSPCTLYTVGLFCSLVGLFYVK